MFKKQNPHHRAMLLACVASLLAGTCLIQVQAQEADSKKLKVVVLMGQSNMVGYAHPSTAWYLTQPIYTPPIEAATAKTKNFSSSNFYWKSVGIGYSDSPEFYAKGLAMLDEHKEIIKLWRGRVYDNFSRTAQAEGKTLEKNDWNTKEWGPPPIDEKGNFRAKMGEFLTRKVAESGVEKRMLDHIESPDNKFHPSEAFKAIAKRDELIAEDLKRVREIFIKDAKPEDFDALDEAIKSFGKVTADNRMEYSKLVQKHIHTPIPERTHIAAIGAVAGETFPADDERQAMSHGPLSFGFTKMAERCGPEYPFGVSFERAVDGPVLLIKCAWGGKSLKGDFRPPSLATKDEPTGTYWKLSMDYIHSVLADPGKYHPDYDAKAGIELAGLVWFQGWNDKGSEEYGDQLVHFIKDVRKELKAPKLPVVCGLLGHDSWSHVTFAEPVNRGMLQAAQHPDLKGTVDIVNTLKYYPIELGLLGVIKSTYGEDSKEYKQAQSVISRATSKDPVHYHGSAKFGFLTGDAMARSLSNLMAGGEPTIHQEAERLLGSK